LAVAVIEKDIPPIVSAGGNVVNCAVVFNAKRPGHGRRLRNYDLSDNPKLIFQGLPLFGHGDLSRRLVTG